LRPPIPSEIRRRCEAELVYKPKTGLEKYYAVLFKLPSIPSIVVTTIVINIIAYLLNKQVLFTAFSLYVLTVMIILVYSKIFNGPLRYANRILMTGLLVEMYSLILMFILGPRYGLIASSIFLIIIVLGINGTSIRNYVVATIPVIVTYLIYYGLDAILFIGVFLAVLLDYVIYKVMSIHKLAGYPAPDLGTLFVKNWLDRDRTIEKVFSEISVEQKVKPRILKIGDGYLVYTDIHYGPFSNVGSSMFPRILEELSEKPVLTLHGAGSHDRDIPSYEQARQYAEKILECIKQKCRFQKIKSYSPFSISIEDGWEFLVIPFTSLNLVFISRTKGIDDLPYEYQTWIEKICENKGLSETILIDCHNHEVEEPMNFDTLKKGLELVIQRLEELSSKEEPQEVYGRIVEVRNIRSLGVIGDKIYGIDLLWPREQAKRIVLIYIPGNNMEPGLSDKIRYKISSELGIDPKYVVVFTNDEHTETGVYSSSTYYPVLETKELMRGINILAEKLKSEKPPYSPIEYASFEHIVPLLDDSAYKLVEIVKKNAPLSSVLLLGYLFLGPFFVGYISSIIDYFIKHFSITV